MHINDDNGEKCYGVSTDIIRKLTDLYLITIGEKSSTNIPLSTVYRLRKSTALTHLHELMYLEFDDYPQYSVIFDTHINRNMICIHGYTNCVAQNDLITWVSKYFWVILLSGLHKLRIYFHVPGQ